MRNNETGEFELVVGNRQLLSGFFIVVLLFAVAFAMGYVVGQNSPRSPRLSSDPASASPVTSASDSRPMPASPVPAPPRVQPADQGAQPAADGSPQPSTQPATQPARDPNGGSPTEAARGVAGTAAAASSELVPSASLPPGSFWQLMAIRQPEADAMRQTLKDKGFPAVLSPGPNNLTRVLVGPYSDTQSFGRAKTDLENAGFQPPVRYKRD
jgi:cell division septation protein DedD